MYSKITFGSFAVINFYSFPSDLQFGDMDSCQWQLLIWHLSLDSFWLHW